MKVSLILLFAPVVLIAQQNAVREMKPYNLTALELSAEGEQKFESDRVLYAKISEKLSKGVSEEDLTQAEQEILRETSETIENYWEIIGGGCSWYCGGGPLKVTASSALTQQGTNTYDGKNAHDLSYKNAWVEGVKGNGIGESLVYEFAAESPRITDIIVVNGYVKSERAYLENSRVKKLKVYLNDAPLAILLLEDMRSAQKFKFQPIGNGDRRNLEALKSKAAWTLKFEILEVYKGLKYEDVAITEIYFDGIDVH